MDTVCQPVLLTPELARILAETPALRQAYLVGGCVRDWLWGSPVKDYDLEVFGISYRQLAQALEPWGRTDIVGRSFGVLKLTTASGVTYDFSLPRRDSKTAPGHQGFAITFDPAITPREAAARRDFTINSLMFDPREKKIIDFFDGIKDLQNCVLRHTSPAFAEDPLRVLRGMQFAGRFGLRAAPETLALCRQIQAGHQELAVERLREEWFKWAEKSRHPSAGLRFLDATGWIEHYPELAALRGVPQDPEWHPEGDVFVHTGHCCDALVGLPEWQEAEAPTKIVCMLAILTHDLGKAAVTQKAMRQGRWRIVSPGHEEAGVELATAFLRRINTPLAVVDRVLPLVANHLAHLQTITDRSVRRLARRLTPENLHSLCAIIAADSLGRPPGPLTLPESLLRLRAKAAELRVQKAAPTPILMGRHLVSLGLPPGKIMGPVLAAAYEAQLEGRIQDLSQAMHWLRTQQEWEIPESVRTAAQQWPPAPPLAVP